MQTPEDYAKEAKEYKDRGFNAYKIHPPGNYELDLEIHKAARNAGDEFKLMSDPVAPYTFEQALRLGRELEKLNYYWYEEPLFDENFHNKRAHSDTRYPIIGTEVIATSL